MRRSDASSIYSHFVAQVASSTRAWCLTCHGDICAIHGASGHVVLPLWSDAETARYLTAAHWPHLETSQLSLRELLWRCLPVAANAGIPAGVGVEIDAEAVVVPAVRLRHDLIEARAGGLTRGCS